MSVILSLDQGTTSSRAIVFDQAGAILGVSQQEFEQHYPQPGWVEHDANEIWTTQLHVAQEVLRQCGMTASDVASIGIANQRETTLLWDRKTGEPVYNAIVWQDRRTADYCESLVNLGHNDLVQQKTGLLLDSYFCATKIHWLLENVPGLKKRADRGEIAFGTIDSWLLWKLTSGRLHVTDITNASRTMLFDISACEWSDDLLSLFQIPRSILPEVLPSSHVFGESDTSLLGSPIKLGGAAGDQQAALFGQNGNQKGVAKNTYGTGCFLLMNAGQEPIQSQHKLLTTIASSVGAQTEYALEGSIFIAGAVVQWLRDGLGIIDSSQEVEQLAKGVVDTDGVYVVPAFAGLGAPHWDSYARGTIVGVTRGTTKAHIARAALESIAFQVADVIDAMQQDAGAPLQELRVDGGASNNDLLMQFQADLLQVPVVRPKVVETTALGAAYLAGLAVGLWKDTNEIANVWQADRVFEPSMSKDEVELRRNRWSDALTRSRGWASGNTE